MSDQPVAKRSGFPLRLDQLGGVTPRPGLSLSGLDRKPVAAAVRTVLRPQELLKHAAALAARPSTPSGTGLDSADVRRRMVERLRRGGLRDDKVCKALAAVPRHLFVDSAFAAQAYEDTSLPIGHGQTISKPSVVSRMIELLLAGVNARQKDGLGKVLEIGTGCGYQAALLADMSQQVLSIERLKALHDKARVNLEPLRIWRDRIRLVFGDGMLGHPPNAPYDSIIAAAGGDAIPSAWLEQMAVGGRLVAPVQDAAGRQALVVIDRDDQGYHRSVHEGVHFVPLKSGFVR